MRQVTSALEQQTSCARAERASQRHAGVILWGTSPDTALTCMRGSRLPVLTWMARWKGACSGTSWMSAMAVMVLSPRWVSSPDRKREARSTNTLLSDCSRWAD